MLNAENTFRSRPRFAAPAFRVFGVFRGSTSGLLHFPLPRRSETKTGCHDFAFQLAAAEFTDLKSKPAPSKAQDVAKQEDAANSSQFAMSSAQVPEHDPKADLSRRSFRRPPAEPEDFPWIKYFSI
jgi:hypothetical protein